MHLHTYVTELALAAEPSRLPGRQAPRPRVPGGDLSRCADERSAPAPSNPSFLSSGTTRERLVNQPSSVPEQYDAVVVGAGFSGLYMLYRLRQLGLSVKVFDSAGDVGGTWYWNRYPGARCDIPTTDYAYSFDPELEKEWTWSEKYATQPEILDYLRLVADRHGLRSDIEFSTAVTSARWDEQAKRWRITTERGREVQSR